MNINSTRSTEIQLGWEYLYMEFVKFSKNWGVGQNDRPGCDMPNLYGDLMLLFYLQQLRHDHLVNLIEVFRRKKRLYLVFEFVDHTVLDELEKCPNGLDENTVRRILWQVLKGTEFCHLHNASYHLHIFCRILTFIDRELIFRASKKSDAAWFYCNDVCVSDHTPGHQTREHPGQ